MNRTALFVFMGLALLGSAGSYLVFSGDAAQHARLSERNASADILRWREAIRTEGPERAFETFVEAVSAEDQNQQHQMAHWFGAALYLEAGADGLAVCDSRFSFGCYHEFLGQAIADLGIESVVDMNERCRQALGDMSLSCQHGIGHGVQTFFGYERDALDDALAVCEGLPYADPIGGCYGGAFMEYNVRTMLGLDSEPRRFAGDPHEPCASLAGPHRLACYYWQPQWWVQVLYNGRPTPADYRTMGSHCDSIDDRRIKGHCFEGIGNMTEQASGGDPALARMLCDAVSEKPGARLYCRSVAANHFGIDVSPDAGKEVCEGLEGGPLGYCLEHASNRYNVMVQGEFPLTL